MKYKQFLKLRGLVVQRGYTLRVLAKELGITEQALSNKLNGRTQFTLQEIVRTCDFLNASTDIFFDAELHNAQ